MAADICAMILQTGRLGLLRRSFQASSSLIVGPSQHRLEGLKAFANAYNVVLCVVATGWLIVPGLNMHKMWLGDSIPFAVILSRHSTSNPSRSTGGAHIVLSREEVTLSR